MPKSTVFSLVLGTTILAIGFYPLALLRIQMPSETFTATTTDGVQIVYDTTVRSDASADAPTAILLHGFAGNRIMMKMIAYALADKGLTCVSVDLRGHGSSEGNMGGLDQFSNDVKEVIQSLQVKGVGNTSRIVLIGHSMGGGVALTLGSQLPTAVATIGVAPVSSPDWVNTTVPRNLLLIVSTGDAVIDFATVEQTFYESVNGTLAFGEPHDVDGTMRELFVVEGPDHLNILYNALVIDEIVRWTTRYVLGLEQSLTVSPVMISAAVYVSLVGGTMVILSALALTRKKKWQERRKTEAKRRSDRKTLLRIGFTGFLLAGIFGSLIGIGISLSLQAMTPLFFTNFITALFLGNSTAFGFLARAELKRSSKDFSYLKFIKGSISKPSLIADAILGSIGAIAFLVLFSQTLGQNTTSTFSTASPRLVSLPLYLVLFSFVFMFYESFFKGLARPMIGDGVKRMVYSVLFELAVLLSSFLLELAVVTTILSLYMPFIGLDFFVLGLNLVIISLVTSITSAEVFYELTDGWIAQIIVSALIFATLATVLSPSLLF